jgi:hypothetical protein
LLSQRAFCILEGVQQINPMAIKRPFYCALLFLICSFAASAQQTDSLTKSENSPQFPTLTLRTAILRNLVREANFGIEMRRSFTHGHEVRLGYVYSSGPVEQFYEKWAVSTLGKFRGPTVAYQYRYYFHLGKHPRYLLLGTMYRYQWFTNAYHSLSGFSTSTYDEEWIVLSQWRNDLIVKAAFGLNADPRKALHFELGFGAWFRDLYTRASDCKSCGYPVFTFDGRLQEIRNRLDPLDGFSVSPWLHFTFSYLIYPKRKENQNFGQKPSSRKVPEPLLKFSSFKR